MRRRTNNKRRMETILVAGATTVPAAGPLVPVAGGTALSIANGEIGILSADLEGVRPAGEFLAAGELVADAYAIKFVQGTPRSNSIHLADPWEAGDKHLVESDLIFADSIRAFRADAPVTSRNDAKLVDLTDVIMLDDAEYKMFVDLSSVRNDRDYGDNDEVVHASFETPDNTALGTVNPLDQMVQNVAQRIMVQSKAVSSLSNRLNKGNRNVMAFAMRKAGGADAGFTPTVIGGIAEGTVIPVILDDGNPVDFIADKAFVRALAQLVANSDYTVFSEILMVDLAAAGTVAAGADGILVMGLDEDLPRAFDNIMQVKTSVNVEVASAMRTTTGISTSAQDVSTPLEGENSGRNWNIRFDSRAFGTVHNMELNRMSDYLIQPPKYFDVDGIYYAYIIEYWGREETLTTEERNPMRTVILIEANYVNDAENVTALVAKGVGLEEYNFVEAPAVSAISAAINAVAAPWLNDANGIRPFSKDGDQTAFDGAATFFTV